MRDTKKYKYNFLHFIIKGNRMSDDKTTTIAVPKRIAKELKRLKIHRNQPFWEVIERLLKENKKKRKIRHSRSERYV